MRAPSTFNEAWCSPLVMYWIREIVVHLCPWIAGTSIALLLPLRQAAWAQALIVAAAVVNAEQRRRRTVMLCALGTERYARLASWVTDCVLFLLPLPLPLRTTVLAWQRQLAAPLAFHQVDLFLHLAVSYFSPLVLLRRWELRQRQALARQRRRAAEASALVRMRREQGSWLWYLCFPALLWMLCLFVLHSLARLDIDQRLHALLPPATASRLHRLWAGPY